MAVVTNYRCKCAIGSLFLITFVVVVKGLFLFFFSLETEMVLAAFIF